MTEAERGQSMRVELLGNKYHYETFGESQGQPVVFLHGFAQNLHTWDAVRDVLLDPAESRDAAAPPLRLILLDLIGHGASDKPQDLGPYTLPHMVDVLDEFRRVLELGRFHLVGYSMGGRIALTYAIERPRTLESLVLESSSFGPRSPAEKTQARKRDDELAELLEMSSADEFAEWWLDTPVIASQKELPLELRESEAAMRRANDTGALARVTRGAGQGQMDDLFDAAGHMRSLLYVCGEKDDKYSGLAALGEGRWGLDVRRFPTGHNVHLEQPAEYARMLLTFYASGYGRRR